MTRTLVVIPARGGSKGIPRKNLQPLRDRPLIAWTIEQALAIEPAAGERVDVLVSTDDAEIADAAREAGAQVPFLRPAELARDTTPTEPVIEHAIDFQTGNDAEPDRVMLLQATSPVRRPGTLDRALREFTTTGVDSLVGVVPQAPFLWWQGSGGADPRADYDVRNRLRRQEMTPEMLRYRETGSLYVTRTDIYRTEHNRLGGRIGLFVMDEAEGVDIDTPLDLAVAERSLRSIDG